MGKVNTRVLNRRIYLLAVFLGAALLALGVHYGRIMLGPREIRPAQLSNLDVERGPILDRNGRLLAIQSELPTVTVWTPYVEDVERSARTLSRILNIPEEELRQTLSIPNRDVIIKRTISPSEADVIQILKQQGELREVSLRRDVGRIYPEGSSAAHVIGFTGVDNVGLEGIELTQNSMLSPLPQVPGTRIYGNQLFLTIDIVMQHNLEQIALRLMEEHLADSVMIMVMSARTGEMLSWVSMPNFDPNALSSSSAEERRNRPIQLSYEPGSVFKIFSLASFMQLGGVNNDSRFATSGGYINDQIQLPITDLGNYGVLSPEGIIRYSSNVGAAYASDTVDRESFYRMLRQFGFGQPTGIEINGEESGILAPEERWSNRTKPTIAIGQEIGVTALQMMQAASALANGGVMLRPQIIRRVVSPSGELVQDLQIEQVRQVLRPEVAGLMLEYMKSAAEETGTGRRAAVDGFDISVKTGTAEVIDPETGRYSDELFIASTMAIFPTDNPELISYVVIQHPRGDSFLGGRIAAPVINEIVNFLIPYLQLEEGGIEKLTLAPQLEITEPALPALVERVPDYRGLPLKTLMPLYSRNDISLHIEGSGWVIRQDPAPGTLFQEGMDIRLILGDQGD